MKFVDEFRRGGTVHSLTEAIHKLSGNKKMTFMEVCGTHTMSIARNGIKEFLPDNITLVSGPGCPVCVTSNHTIDKSIAFSRLPDVIVTTFGDMMKVPGSSTSLDLEHARGGDIRVVTSTLEALLIAEKMPTKKVVFLGVGFETTAPTVATSVIEARYKRLENYFVLSAHKLIPPAMEVLSRGEVKIDGYICPGHVSAIIGSKAYESLSEMYGIGCVITGFEPLDILQGILMLVDQFINEKPHVEIQYTRVVRTDGNPKAQAAIQEVFEVCNSYWRGIGLIPKSGLRIRENFAYWDAENKIQVEVEETKEPEGCLCGQVLQGKVIPPQCGHFGKTCTPEKPVGPCMVSSEGTCAAYYKYGR